MTLERIVGWIDRTLDVAAFDDMSNNGVQVARTAASPRDADVRRVAFAVDASAASVRAAAAAGAQLLVVHHGISWGGGIKRLVGGAFAVVKAAMDANLAIYACHLPLDAHPTLGNNAQLAKLLGLAKTRPTFACRGRAVGLTGEAASLKSFAPLGAFASLGALSGLDARRRLRVGVCSGGGGGFAEEALRLGCDVLVTGEADWGETVAAENCGMRLLCCGHYETEVFGVRALAEAMAKALKVEACPVGRLLGEMPRDLDFCAENIV